MGWRTLEHSMAAYRADLWAYGLAATALGGVAVAQAPTDAWVSLAALAACGLVGWTLMEYLMHRFVLHGLAPFRHWHQEHHAQPRRLLSTPTVMSAALFAVLVWAPLWAWLDAWRAAAVSAGVLAGYAFYTFTHHAVHHAPQAFSLLSPSASWRRVGRRILARKRHWHAAHRQHLPHLGATAGAAIGGYGVTTDMWDRLFGTLPETLAPRRSWSASAQTLHRAAPTTKAVVPSITPSLQGKP